MSRTANLTVSIVAYRSNATLPAALRSLRHHLPHTRVVIVDHDGTVSDTLSRAPHTTVLRAPNEGFGAGHNRAIAHLYPQTPPAHALHLFFNPDAYLTTPLAPLLEVFAHRRVAIAGPLLTDAAGHPDPYCAGAAPGIWHDLRAKLHPPQLPQTTTRVARVSGAAMVVRVRDFLRCGGFDARYFLYFEDTDLCTRMRNSGKDILFVPSVSVRHSGGGSFRSHRTQKRHYDKSKRRYYRTHTPYVYALLSDVLTRLRRRCL